jgi:integrase
MRLTAAAVKALTLPPGVSERTFFDDELGGFGVRLRSTGIKRWVLQYDIAGRTRRVTLGSPALLDPGAARNKARDLLAGVRLGADPAVEKRQARQRAAETFSALLPRFLAVQRAKRRPRSYTEIERHLVKYARPLHPQPIANIDRRAIAGLVSALATSSGPVAARAARGSLSGFFSWATAEGLLDANPVTLSNLPVTNGPRARVLSSDELRTIWAALDADTYGDVVRLLIYTAARRQEIGGLRWDEMAAAELRLPPERCKNNKPHTIPLSAPALAILQRRPRTGPFVFGRNGETAFQGWSWRKAALDARIGDKVAPWTLHDIRRTAVTVMCEQLGIAPYIADACLGHLQGGAVQRVYNRSTYVEERRRALEKWASFVDAATSGKRPSGKIVKLHK